MNDGSGCDGSRMRGTPFLKQTNNLLRQVKRRGNGRLISPKLPVSYHFLAHKLAIYMAQYRYGSL